ncbi:hypothetical protein D3C77_728850 [compost metagenome]
MQVDIQVAQRVHAHCIAGPARGGVDHIQVSSARGYLVVVGQHLVGILFEDEGVV